MRKGTSMSFYYTSACAIIFFGWLNTKFFAVALVGSDGLCSLYSFVPLTTSVPSPEVNMTPPRGYFHMASALLAMQHFNDRNPVVVPELANLNNCSVQFDLNRSQFFDSGDWSHVAADTFVRHVLHDGVLPCALAGPYFDLPAIDLAVLAEATKLPLVASRALTPRVVHPDAGTYGSQVYPDAADQTDRVVDGLRRLQRTDYVSILYPDTEYGLSVFDAMVVSLEQQGATHWNPAHYIRPGRENPAPNWDSLRQALVGIKERGFRTIVVATEYSELEIPALAEMAHELDMVGDYFWVWIGYLFNSFMGEANTTLELLYGSARFVPFEPMLLRYDTFMEAIATETQPFFDLVDQHNPIPMDDPNYIFGFPGLFNITMGGQEWMYDAVMSIGIGACLAQTESNGEILGSSHVNGIRRADFRGATGRVRFQQTGETPGARVADDVTFVTWNSLGTPDVPYDFHLTDIYDAQNMSWVNQEAFIYGDGSENPTPLRNDPNQNFLNAGLRILGFFLFATVVLLSIATSAWVYWNRKSKVLTAAQPYFLYLLSFGSAVFASGIVPLSFDESYGWSQKQLSDACSATTWLLSLGYTMTYCALFSKLYRVNKVLKFSRRKVSMRKIIWPTIVLITASLVVLTVWTSVDHLQWQRVVIDDYNGNSIGRCESDYLAAYSITLAIISIVPMILTAWMAWKTRDVDGAYSESMWIFILIVLQLELCLLGAPVLSILRNLSTNGRYIGFVIIIWVFPMSTLVLIMLPKILAFYRAKKGLNTRRVRGSHSGVQISGLSNEFVSKDFTPADTGASSSHEDKSSHFGKRDNGGSFVQNRKDGSGAFSAASAAKRRSHINKQSIEKYLATEKRTNDYQHAATADYPCVDTTTESSTKTSQYPKSPISSSPATSKNYDVETCSSFSANTSQNEKCIGRDEPMDEQFLTTHREVMHFNEDQSSSEIYKSSGVMRDAWFVDNNKEPLPSSRDAPILSGESLYFDDDNSVNDATTSMIDNVKSIELKSAEPDEPDEPVEPNEPDEPVDVTVESVEPDKPDELDVNESVANSL